MKNFFKKLFCSDSMSKHFSETVRRIGKNNAGFSLVELIVVIAIMAILAAVAVIGVSVYIPKAQQAADEQLFADIEKAIELAYLGEPSFNGGYVMVSATGATASNSYLETAMADTFGANWKTELTLQCDDWVSPTYQNSSYYGKETQLLSKVDTLTGYLQDAIVANPELIGNNFNSYLGDLGVQNSTENAAAVADAAVLYVADNGAALTPEQREAAVNAMCGIINKSPAEATAELTGAFNNNTVAAAAALYAIAQSYCQYEQNRGNNKPLEILDEQEIVVDSSAKAIDAVYSAFGKVAEEVMDSSGNDKGSYSAHAYFNGAQARNDAEAYLDMLSAVSNSKSEVLGSSNLGDDDFFTNDTVSDVFVTIADGGVMITAKVVNGELVVEYPTR